MANPLDDAARAILAGVLGGVMTQPGTVRRYNAYSFADGDGGDTLGNIYSARMGPPTPFKVREVDGSQIQQGDVQAILDAATMPEGYEPDTERDRVVLPGGIREWSIVGFEPIGMEEAVGWTLHLRR